MGHRAEPQCPAFGDVSGILADRDAAFMILGRVQIPTEVLTAWEEGNLVLFTGAGISIAPESGLPGFEDLAFQVARTVGSWLDPKSAEWRGQLDTFMDVHRLVQGIVTRQGSKPRESRLRRALEAAGHSWLSASASRGIRTAAPRDSAASADGRTTTPATRRMRVTVGGRTLLRHPKPAGDLRGGTSD